MRSFKKQNLEGVIIFDFDDQKFNKKYKAHT